MYVISRVKISIVSDFVTQNIVFVANFLEIYYYCPFLTENGHFLVTKYENEPMKITLSTHKVQLNQNFRE